MLGTMYMPTDEYYRLRSLEKQLEEVQRLYQLEVKESERLRALVEKGQIEEALAQKRKEWEERHAKAIEEDFCNKACRGHRPPQPDSLEAIVSDWWFRQTQYQSFGLHPKS